MRADNRLISQNESIYLRKYDSRQSLNQFSLSSHPNDYSITSPSEDSGIDFKKCKVQRTVCSTILGASQYVGSIGPTVLPIRKMPLALMSDPLDNH